MASSTRMQQKEIGVIILGNTGAGKSYLCNLIIGENKFQVGCKCDAVTTITQYHRMVDNPFDMMIYDIPGLLEMDQQSIDRNKKEINKAFAQCPKSFVLFIWRQFHGRISHEDVIVFKALNKAFEFPAQCLLHVVNNTPKDQEPDYELQTMLWLSKALNGIDISPENTLFIETSDPADEQKRRENRTKLYYSLRNRVPHHQKKEGNIKLPADEINEAMETVNDQ